MTDNEIIKALECCIRNEICCVCDECPLETRPQCEEVLYREVVDLINRQKAEVERLQKQLKEGIDLSDSVLKIVKSETRKEFAERFGKALKNFDLSSVGLPDYDRGYSDCLSAVEDTLDGLVAEMEEEGASNER